MSVCPVCETPPTPGALECATCGHIFQMAAVDASIQPLAELEPTSARALEVSVEATPGLEPTRFEAGGPAIPEAVEGLEATATAAVQVVAEFTPDLEPTRVVPDDELPSALPPQIRCRYCGSEGQASGLFCDRCGMRLPRLAEAAPPTAPTPPEVSCRSCGASVFVGGLCARCGARAPSTG